MTFIPHISSSYFDEDYFKPGEKSSYILPFTWEVEAPNSRQIAERLDNIFGLSSKNIPNTIPKTILDVGCAKGFLVKALLEKNIDAYGFDISTWAIEHCEPEVKNRVYVDDISNISNLNRNFNRKYDIVYSSSAIEHVNFVSINPQQTIINQQPITNLCNLSKEWIFLSIPIGLSLYNEPWGEPSHMTYMNPSWWICLFLKEGFIFDMRKSRQIDDNIFHSAELVFRKNNLL